MNEILAEWEKSKQHGIKFIDFAKGCIDFTSPKDIISSLRELHKAKAIPEGTIFPAAKLSRKEFAQVSRGLSADIKFDVTMVKVFAEWGSLNDIDLNNIAAFHPKWVDSVCGVVPSNSYKNVIFPKNCDLSSVNLEGVEFRKVDLRNAYMQPRQLVYTACAENIRLPEKLKLKPIEKWLGLLAPSITANGGWTLNGNNVRDTDLSAVEGLDVGKLFREENRFVGVKFPEYNWVKPTPENDYKYDDLTGLEFISCDLSKIYGLSMSDLKQANIHKCETAFGPYDTPSEPKHEMEMPF